MASAHAVAQLSSDEFLRLYEADDSELHSYELFDGEVIERPMTNRVHDRIKNLVCKALDRYLEQNKIYVALVETTFRLAPRTTFTPDIAVVKLERWDAMTEKFASGAPDVAFEVISTETADRLKFKTDAYLDFGSKAVCCIYPNQRKIMVFEPGRVSEYKQGEQLEFPSIFPGFAMPLSAIF